jgi:uncharacterized protein
MSEGDVEFRPIELGHKDIIEHIRRCCGHNLSSHAFSSLFIWQEQMKLKLYLSKQLFCIRCEDKDNGNYFFPCGSDEEKLRFIPKLLNLGAVSFRYMREEDRCFLEKYFPGRFEFESAREDWEYVYAREEQVRLEGSEFKHLRSKVHKGEQAHDWTTIKLSRETIPLAADITRSWRCEAKHNAVSADIGATLKALKFFDELNLSGVLMLNGQVPLAFALGTVISEDTFDLHISKTLEKDIDCYLKWELFKQLPDQIAYINREEDLGIEGLRIHKIRMKPVRFNELWKGWTGV